MLKSDFWEPNTKRAFNSVFGQILLHVVIELQTLRKFSHKLYEISITRNISWGAIDPLTYDRKLDQTSQALILKKMLNQKRF